MDNFTDYFDLLPEEVTQLIFYFVTDWKSLIRCMVVSKAFRQQAVRLSSLSIVCPGTFSSYDERLSKIYSMVKPFKNLKSLVVRVGQPKEEPPSWARCMRYAEIGESVEKFVFMAAKSGDFSELDVTLLGLDDTNPSICKTKNGINHQSNHVNATMETISLGREFVETTIPSNIEQVQENRTSEIWSDSESDDEIISRGESATLGRNGKQLSKGCIYSRTDPWDASFLQDPGPRKQLSNFNLRRVISPSNDVLKRMLPVIHFAIVQGLDELRDAIPPFITQFRDLKSFLLVDMAESITVFLRDHHIEEMKSLYHQELDALAMDALQPSLNRMEERIKNDSSRGSISNIENGCFLGDKSAVDVEGGGIHRRSSEAINIMATEVTPNYLVKDCCIQSLDGSSQLECRYDGKENSHDFVNSSKLNMGKGTYPVVSEACSFTKNGDIQTGFLFDTGMLKGKDKVKSADSFLDSEGSSSSQDSLSSTEEVSSDKAISFGTFLERQKNDVNKNNSHDVKSVNETCCWASPTLSSSKSLSTSIINGKDISLSSSSATEFELKELKTIQFTSVFGKDKQGELVTESSGVNASKGQLSRCLQPDGSSNSGTSTLGSNCSIASRVLNQQKIRDLQRFDNEVSTLPDLSYNTCMPSVNDEGCTNTKYLRRDRNTSTVLPGAIQLDVDRSTGAGQNNDTYNSYSSGTRSTETDTWRHDRQDRIRRLRDSLLISPDTQESRQKRSRDLWRRRQRALEKDALSFDYTFWRAEQVASCNYVMSDISMCIVTNAAKPLRDADKEVLLQAAIAGPLLAATVSHVNNQYSSHNL